MFSERTNPRGTFFKTVFCSKYRYFKSPPQNALHVLPSLSSSSPDKIRKLGGNETFFLFIVHESRALTINYTKVERKMVSLRYHFKM